MALIRFGKITVKGNLARLISSFLHEKRRDDRGREDKIKIMKDDIKIQADKIEQVYKEYSDKMAELTKEPMKKKIICVNYLKANFFHILIMQSILL